MKKSLLSVALIGGLAVTGFGTHQAQAASSTSVVSLAEQGIGSAYSWGQNDCSGFTMRVFSHLGIQLPHSAAGQAGYGSAVSRSDLQPGDLVFFNTSGSGISHVGIYVGNNRMISAETKKTGVRETQIFGGGASSYWEPRYVTARRIATNSQPAAEQSTSATPSKKSTTETQSSTQSDSQAQSSSSTEQAAAPAQPGSTSSDQASTNDDRIKSDAAKSNDSKSVVNASDGTSSAQMDKGIYLVQTGDTLWSISNQNGISVQKIQQINKLEDTLIQPGQKIYLQDPSEQYTIKSGDNLWTIAKEHGTTVEQLMKINNLSSDRIYPDQGLTISSK